MPIERSFGWWYETLGQKNRIKMIYLQVSKLTHHRGAGTSAFTAALFTRAELWTPLGVQQQRGA